MGTADVDQDRMAAEGLAEDAHGKESILLLYSYSNNQFQLKKVHAESCVFFFILFFLFCYVFFHAGNSRTLVDLKSGNPALIMNDSNWVALLFFVSILMTLCLVSILFFCRSPRFYQAMRVSFYPKVLLCRLHDRSCIECLVGWRGMLSRLVRVTSLGAMLWSVVC